MRALLTRTLARAGNGARPTQQFGPASTRSRTRSFGRSVASREGSGRAYTAEGRRRPPRTWRGHRLCAAGAEAFDPSFLTIGFARRLATYKRLNLILHDTPRALDLLDHDRPAQFVFAGKAHPLDDAAKAIAQRMFALRRSPGVGNRVVFIEDYDLSVAGTLIAGCDVWLNLPRPRSRRAARAA